MQSRQQAQIALLNAYNNLAGRPTSVDLTGQNLGGRALVPGVYNFSSAAQLTGALTLNGLGNPNSVFIFKIGSTLTTASASAINADQRRARRQCVLAGRQLRDARYGHIVHRRHPRAYEHHA